MPFGDFEPAGVLPLMYLLLAVVTFLAKRLPYSKACVELLLRTELYDRWLLKTITYIQEG